MRRVPTFRDFIAQYPGSPTAGPKSGACIFGTPLRFSVPAGTLLRHCRGYVAPATLSCMFLICFSKGYRGPADTSTWQKKYFDGRALSLKGWIRCEQRMQDRSDAVSDHSSYASQKSRGPSNNHCKASRVGYGIASRGSHINAVLRCVTRQLELSVRH